MADVTLLISSDPLIELDIVGPGAALAIAESTTQALRAEAAADDAEARGAAQVAKAAGFADLAQATLLATSALVGPNASTLAKDYVNGLFIDVSGDPDISAVVKDVANPANNKAGDLETILTANAFFNPKMVLRSDGSISWSPHNNMVQSGNFGTAPWSVSSASVTAGQVGSDGRTASASLLQATSTTSGNLYLNQAVVVQAGWHRTDGWEVKAGTTGWAAIEISDNAVIYRAYFNLTTGVVGTVDAGLTATISRFDHDGDPYATGWFYCSVQHKGVAANGSNNVRIRPVDADGSPAVTTGKNILIDKARTHLGVNRLAYLPTTTVSRVGVPYDYWNGEQQVRFDSATTYKARHSDDFTNAVWIKTNTTAALNATGPHGEPCSTITATAAGGFVEQAVVSTGTSQMGYVWIRRKVGTGPISISMDGGVTSKVVTAEIGSVGGLYKVAYQRGFVANPTLRIILGTSGDAVEVALANVTTTQHVAPPVPSTTADYTMSANNGKFALSQFPTASAMTVFVDGTYSPDKKTGESGSTYLGFFGAGAVKIATDLNMAATGGRIRSAFVDGVVTRTQQIRGFITGGRVQTAVKYQANRHVIAVNGEVPYIDNVPGAATLTDVGFTTGESFWLSRMVMIPEAVQIDNDDLRRFFLEEDGENVNPIILGTHLFYEAGQRTDANLARVPALTKLWEDGDRCSLLATCGERYFNGYDAEHPQRGLMERIVFDKATGRFTSDTGGLQVFLEHPTRAWNTGLGGIQGSTPLKITSGPYRGRTLNLFIQQDSASGTKTGDNRNIYSHWSDNNGDDWSARVKVVDSTTFGGSFVAMGENSTAFQMPFGPNKDRVYYSINMINARMGVMWCDDFKDGGDGSGANWSYTPFANAIPNTGNVNIPGSTFTEPGVFLLPDGRVGIAMRNNNVGGAMAYAISPDGGVTFDAAQPFLGENTSNATNQGVLQIDPNGGHGRTGRLIVSRGTTDGGFNHVVQETTDASFTLGNTVRVLGQGRFGRYTALESAFNAGVLFVLVEIQPVGPANLNTGMMLIAFEYPTA